jgi:hypothetical protein
MFNFYAAYNGHYPNKTEVMPVYHCQENLALPRHKVEVSGQAPAALTSEN